MIGKSRRLLRKKHHWSALGPTQCCKRLHRKAAGVLARPAGHCHPNCRSHQVSTTCETRTLRSMFNSIVHETCTALCTARVRRCLRRQLGIRNAFVLVPTGAQIILFPSNPNCCLTRSHTGDGSCDHLDEQSVPLPKEIELKNGLFEVLVQSSIKCFWQAQHGMAHHTCCCYCRSVGSPLQTLLSPFLQCQLGTLC